MATVETLVAQARRKLRGTKREPFNVLAAEMTSGQDYMDLDVPLVGLGGISTTNYLCAGAEIMYVTAVDSAAKRVTVQRGVDGTPISTHAAGTRVEINWRWLTADLLTDLAHEIRSWGDGIFKVVDSGVLSMGIASRSVDLPLTRFRYALELRQKFTGRQWVSLPAGRFRVETGLPTDEFASGNALIISGACQTSQLILTYAQGYDLTAVETLTTDLADIGLTETLYDAAIYGIAFRALAGDEAGRLDEISQPEPRAAEDVDAFDAMRAASAYKAIRDLRLEEEKRRLRTLYPVKVA